MGAGTPVVAVGAMGILDVMASGRGGFVTRLDLGAFSERVAKLLSDPRLRDRKSLEALEESAEMAKRMPAVYAEAGAAVTAEVR